MSEASRQRTVLRLPDALRERLENAARASGRTINAEAVARLELSFEGTLRPTTSNAVKTLLAEATEARDRYRNLSKEMEKSIADVEAVRIHLKSQLAEVGALFVEFERRGLLEGDKNRKVPKD